jgi:hypothetical protein
MWPIADLSRTSSHFRQAPEADVRNAMLSASERLLSLQFQFSIEERDSFLERGAVNPCIFNCWILELN